MCLFLCVYVYKYHTYNPNTLKRLSLSLPYKLKFHTGDGVFALLKMLSS